MNLYDSYNKIFLIHQYPHYLHINLRGEFIPIGTTQIYFNYALYSRVQVLFHHQKSNVSIFYNCMYSNPFSSKKQLQEFEEVYQKVQRFKFAFSRFKHVVNLRYKKKFNITSLCYEPFTKRTLSIYENGFVYIFNDIEMYNMIENCFNYQEYDIPTLLTLKNPYTNIPFSYHNLIYIYFQLMSYGKVSTYFTIYFKLNFNKSHFFALYNPQLYVNCLSKQYDQLTYSRKKRLLRQMITLYDRKYKAFIHAKEAVLNSLFQRCLKDYFIYKNLISCTYDDEYRLIYKYHERKFKKCLEKIYRLNPNFGRKMYQKKLNGQFYFYTDETLFC